MSLISGEYRTLRDQARVGAAYVIASRSACCVQAVDTVFVKRATVLAFGLSRGVRRNYLEAMNAAARTCPAVAGVVDGEAVAVRVALVPLGEGLGRLFSPVVNVGAGASA